MLVVGVDALMTQLAKCCRPAPPDDIRGFVTRGKGVSIHRADCSDFAHLVRKSPDRVIEVDWSGQAGAARDGQTALYPVDVAIEAADRQGLLRDISDVFAREKMNVIGVQTQSVKGVAWMTFTIEINDARQVARAMAVVGDVNSAPRFRFGGRLSHVAVLRNRFSGQEDRGVAGWRAIVLTGARLATRIVAEVIARITARLIAEICARLRLRFNARRRSGFYCLLRLRRGLGAAFAIKAASATSATTTVAPRRAKAHAVARPIPEPAPVTTATVPRIPGSPGTSRAPLLISFAYPDAPMWRSAGPM